MQRTRWFINLKKQKCPHTDRITSRQNPRSKQKYSRAALYTDGCGIIINGGAYMLHTRQPDANDTGSSSTTPCVHSNREHSRAYACAAEY